MLQTLHDGGVRSQLAGIWGGMEPPEGGAMEENPCEWHIVVDYHINVPIPSWYQEEMEKLEATLDAAEGKIEEDDDDLLDELFDPRSVKLPEGGFEEVLERINYEDDVARMAKQAEKRKRRVEREGGVTKKATKSQGVTEGRSDGGGPGTAGQTSGGQTERKEGVEGPFWVEGEVGYAWMKGDVFTLNATILYEIDIKAGQVRFAVHLLHLHLICNAF